MTERASFIRKISYGIAIAILTVGMMWLSAPATTTKEGGKLAQLRKEYGLAQMNLGEVDPASETIKLATLGLRGIAVNVLWEKANNYKKKEDWTNLTATLEQLAKLQPNFITFWKFQAWNLTYNVSVEFDDFRDRYYYVRRGIQFLRDGEKHNVDNPQLLWDLGWFIGQKIGRADEHKQYRQLFRDDDYDYRPEGSSLEERDNWLTGKDWYLKAIDAVRNKGQSLGRKSERDFYSSPAKSQMNYAEAIEEEGAFEKARRAWIAAAEEWREFGNQVIEHSTGVKLTLGSQSRLEKELADLRAKLDAMVPGTREKLVQGKREALTPEERTILDTPADQLTAEQSTARYHLDEAVRVSDQDVADRIAETSPDKNKEALQLAGQIDRQQTQLDYTINYKRDANYDYWQTRADFEQTTNAIEARRLMYEARRAFDIETDANKAKRLYDEGFAKWRLVIDQFPNILDDEQMTGEDILDYIMKYRDVLAQLDETIPANFPLWEVIENFDREQEFIEEVAAHKARTGRATETPVATPEAVPTPAEPAAPSPEPTPEVAEPTQVEPTPEAEPTPAAPEPATPEISDPAPAPAAESAPPADDAKQ